MDKAEYATAVRRWVDTGDSTEFSRDDSRHRRNRGSAGRHPEHANPWRDRQLSGWRQRFSGHI